MRLRCLLILGAVALAFAPRAVFAAFPVADSTAFPVALGSSNLYAGVATDGQGNSVMVWTRIVPPGSEVLARLFDPAGQPISKILRVTRNGWLPTVAMNARGSFVVVWRDAVTAGPSHSRPMRVQLFAPGGGRVGPVTQVNTVVEAENTLPTLGMDSRGGFAVAWSSYFKGVFVRRFDREGVPLGPESLAVPEGGKTSSSLAVRPDGGLFLVWLGKGLLGRRFGADGAPEGAEFQINQEAVNSLQTSSVAATPDGGFVVAWNLCGASPTQGPPGLPGAPSPCEIKARRFDAEAEPTTEELTVSSADGRTNLAPVVAADDGRGYFAVSWHSCLGFDDCRISTQVYSPRNVPAAEIETVAIGADHTVSPAIAVSPVGFVVVFRSALCNRFFPGCQKADLFGIYGWRFSFPPKPQR